MSESPATADTSARTPFGWMNVIFVMSIDAR
jgi:hypothetical protein